MLAGLVTGRGVVVALAVPFVVGPGWALLQGRRAALRLTVAVSPQQAAEGDVVDVVVHLTADVALDAVAVRAARTSLEPAGAPCVVTAVDPHEPVSVVLRMQPRRWGRHNVGPVLAQGYGPMLLLAGATSVPGAHLDVLPEVSPFEATETTQKSGAYAGAHRSRAIGEGVDFATVRPFVHGDRLRRINWRATARSRDLAVTTTHTDRAVDVVIVLDSLHDVGESGSSSLDSAVRAAAGIAEHYLALGDTVGMLEYGGHQRMLAPGSGRAQLARVRSWLLDTRQQVTAAVVSVRWPHAFAARAPLTVVLTPLVDEASATLLSELRMRGASVVAVDTLPASGLPPAHDQVDRLVRRLWLLERESLVARLGDLGVPVVAWSGPVSLDAVLKDLARMASAPRAAMR